MTRSRRIGMVLSLTVLALVAAAAIPHRATGVHRAGAADSRRPGALVPARGALLGAFVSTSGTGWAADDVTGREAQLGRRFDIDHRFQNWTVAFPTPADTWDVDHGRVPMITWQPDTASLDAIAAGSFDDLIRARAAGVAAFGHPMFLRFAHEMNADWYPWSGTQANSRGTTDAPAKYVAAWRHVHDLFVAAGATNAVWVWSPNRLSVPNTAWNAAVNYYPGDGYLDWVGLDGYNRDPAHWRSFTTLFTPLYTEFANRKPIMIGETASVEGLTAAEKATWITAARTAMKNRFPAVAAFVWFDTRKSGFDWRVDSSPASLTAFRALAADPYFHTR
jgi:endoglucanase